MFRQRIANRARTPWLIPPGGLLLLVVALVLVWYGLMLALLALKVSPHTVNSISGYRSVYNALSGVKTADVTGRARLIAGLAGLAVFLVAGFLAYRAFPRPHLTRSPLALGDAERGSTDVAPRAIERVVECAGVAEPGVSSVSGRFAIDRVALGVSVRRAHDVAQILRSVQRRAREALVEHELPSFPVDVTLDGFDRQTRRELQ